MVVAGSDIGHQRPEHIEGGAVAEAFLQFDVGFDLIQRHVAGAFNHHLNTGILGTLGQFTENNQFLNLGTVGRIGQATGTETVSQ